MIGPGVARELARQRELAIVRELERPRPPERPRALGELLPTVTIVAAVLAVVALGGPV